MKDMLKAGDPVPSVQIQTDSGEPFDTASLRGRRSVLFFYPKADTPGCTTEACEFRDKAPDYREAGVEVFGISTDPPSRNAKFRAKYELPYTLLCDPEHRAAEAFGVWKEKSMMGRRYMGVERTTFVIKADGQIEQVFNKVKPAGHAETVLASAR